MTDFSKRISSNNRLSNGDETASPFEISAMSAIWLGVGLTSNGDGSQSESDKNKEEFDDVIVLACHQCSRRCVGRLLKFAIMRGNLAGVKCVLSTCTREDGFDFSEANLLAISAEYTSPPSIIAPLAQYAETITGSDMAPVITLPGVVPIRDRIEIFRLLLDRRPVPLTATWDNPFAYVHLLAIDAPQAAHLLFDRLGESRYFNAVCCENGTMTPLTLSLLYLFWTYKNNNRHQAPQWKTISLLRNAILPLLQLGARLGYESSEWDRNFASRSQRSIYDLFAVSAFFSAADGDDDQLRGNGLPNWTLNMRQHFFGRLLVCAIRQSGFDFRRLSKACDEFLTQPPGDSEAQRRAVARLFAFLHTSFPLSLQEICRLAILSRLPDGKRRLTSIDQLDLPSILGSFLKFSDLLPSTLDYSIY